MVDQYSMTPQERWQVEQRKLEELDPWISPRPLLRNAAGYLVQGAAPAASTAKVSQAEYDRMTYSERLAYAERMSRGRL